MAQRFGKPIKRPRKTTEPLAITLWWSHDDDEEVNELSSAEIRRLTQSLAKDLERLYVPQQMVIAVWLVRSLLKRYYGESPEALRFGIDAAVGQIRELTELGVADEDFDAC